MATKLNLAELALPQTTVELNGEEYMIEALPATYALEFMEKYQIAIESGKPDLKIMKEVICRSVYKDNKLIDTKRFDIVFARKFRLISELYQEVLKFNFEDLFTQSEDSEE